MQRALGPEHSYVARPLTSLAKVHVAQDRYAEAEPLFERALAIREGVHGPEHLFVAETLIGLASLRKKQGRAAEAIALYERALAIKEKTFAADHTELAEIRSNIDGLRSAMTADTAAQSDAAAKT